MGRDQFLELALRLLPSWLDPCSELSLKVEGGPYWSPFNAGEVCAPYSKGRRAARWCGGDPCGGATTAGELVEEFRIWGISAGARRKKAAVRERHAAAWPHSGRDTKHAWKRPRQHVSSGRPSSEGMHLA